jgi:pyruvate/2-oxoglutarate dehydrogenase complex dihydrolipoamide acyltransferase (E2) component
MTIGLTIDHRVADGAIGARFLGDLRARLERADL